MTDVYTGGTFDLIHPGHIRLLAAAKTLAGEQGTLTVALNQDEFILRYKGQPPVQTIHERIEVVSAIRHVDRVIVNKGDEDSKPAILEVQPHLIVVGNDWAPIDRYCRQMSFTQDWLERHQFKVVFLERQTGFASSALRNGRQ